LHFNPESFRGANSQDDAATPFDRRQATQLAYRVSRFFAVLFGIMLGAAVVRAEWPIPTADGTIWQYVLTREGEDRPGTLTRQVFAAKTPAEQNVLRIETAVNGATHSTEFLKNEGKTILATAFRNANGETQTFDPPATVLPGDLNFGAQWNYRGAVAGLDLDLPLKIIGEGEIEVPAGKFHALHFRGEKNDGLFTVADFWFVRGVGSIKEVVTQRGPSGDLLSRNSIELAKLPALSQTKPELKKLEASVSTSGDGDPLDVVSADALQIVARWRGHGLRKNARIRAVWIAQDTGVAPVDFKVDEATAVAPISNAFGKFTLSRPSDGWATGKYRVEFYVDDELSDTVDLTITPSEPRARSPQDF
jgi:hypothetical protein